MLSEGRVRVTLGCGLALAFMLAATMSAAPRKPEQDQLAQDRSRTSASDAAQSPPGFGTPALPRIRMLRIRRIPFEPPKLEHFNSSLSRFKEAIEFIVETEGPIPARAYGPALFVGDVEVSQSERIDETTWRLLALEPERLRPGAPICWGWMKDPEAARQCTQFRYDVSPDAPR